MGEVERLSSDLNLGPPLATILLQRGITSFEEAKEYFRPDLSGLHDPFLMKDMDKAIDEAMQAAYRTLEAIRTDRKIDTFFCSPQTPE